jgi:hypothetical protein
MDMLDCFNANKHLLEEIREEGKGGIVPVEYFVQTVGDYFGVDDVYHLKLGKDVLLGILEIHIAFQDKTEDNFYISLGELEYLVEYPEKVLAMLNETGHDYFQPKVDHDGLREVVTFQTKAVKFVYTMDHYSQKLKNEALGTALKIIRDIILWEKS